MWLFFPIRQTRSKAMTRSNIFRRLGGVAVLAAVVSLVLFCAPAEKAQAKSDSSPWQKMTPADLTAIWWEWALGQQTTNSPLFDDTGADAYVGQPYSDLLFLCGTISIQQLQNGDVEGTVTRAIIVKQGSAIFFPLLNNEWDKVGFAPGHHFMGKPGGNLSIPEMYALAAGTLDEATDLTAQITPANSNFTEPTGNTIQLGYERLVSPVFSYKLPKTNNIYQFNGVNVSGSIAPAVADGYWAFIPADSLPTGNYVLEFGGSEPFVGADNLTHTFTEAITYNITVVP
jgi:hypothetical protein